MRIQFDPSDHTEISSEALQQAEDYWRTRYRKYGWEDVRCDTHGEPIRVTLSPLFSKDGSLLFSGRESYCCEEFAQQIGIEREKLMDDDLYKSCYEGCWIDWQQDQNG